jgi:hypothetical protein
MIKVNESLDFLGLSFPEGGVNSLILFQDGMEGLPRPPSSGSQRDTLLS